MALPPSELTPSPIASVPTWTALENAVLAEGVSDGAAPATPAPATPDGADAPSPAWPRRSAPTPWALPPAERRPPVSTSMAPIGPPRSAPAVGCRGQRFESPGGLGHLRRPPSSADVAGSVASVPSTPDTHRTTVHHAS